MKYFHGIFCCIRNHIKAPRETVSPQNLILYLLILYLSLSRQWFLGKAQPKEESFDPV